MSIDLLRIGVSATVVSAVTLSLLGGGFILLNNSGRIEDSQKGNSSQQESVIGEEEKDISSKPVFYNIEFLSGNKITAVVPDYYEVYSLDKRSKLEPKCCSEEDEGFRVYEFDDLSLDGFIGIRKDVCQILTSADDFTRNLRSGTMNEGLTAKPISAEGGILLPEGFVPYILYARILDYEETSRDDGYVFYSVDSSLKCIGIKKSLHNILIGAEALRDEAEDFNKEGKELLMKRIEK